MHDTSLLPDDYLAEARERRTNIVGLALFALVLGGVAVWFTRTNVEWREVRDRQEQVSGSFSAVALEIRDMQEQERTRELMLEKARLAISLVDPMPRSIILAELVGRMPERVSLIDLQLRSETVRPARAAAPTAARTAPAAKPPGRNVAAGSPDKTAAAKAEPVRHAINLVLTGTAPTDLDVSAYLQALSRFDLFESVRLELSEEREVSGRPTRHFRIAIRIGPDADVRRSRSLLERGGMAGGGEEPPEAEVDSDEAQDASPLRAAAGEEGL